MHAWLTLLEPPLPGVLVATWSLEAGTETTAALYQLLSADERKRADAFTRDEVRRRFVVGRGRLRLWLAEQTGTSPDQIAFGYGPNGKPELAGDSSVHFNLSHSAEQAVCAVSDRPVGVDIEQIRPRRSATALAERWFHPDEIARVQTAADPLGAFYRTWTAKEAALKLVGLGVGESLPKVLTPVSRGIATGLPSNDCGWSTCQIDPLPIGTGFAAALAQPIG